jgi:hypothetical protein
VELDWWNIGLAVAGYLFTFLTSGLVVRAFVGEGAESSEDGTGHLRNKARSRLRVGTIVGKCENFLTITLILENALTGLALIFAAKSIVRADDIKKDPRYYLAGTLVNFSYSVLMGYVIKSLMQFLP